MAYIGFNEESVHKLMDMVDNNKNIYLDDITYIELSNSIKFLFDKLKKEYSKHDIIFDINTITIRGLGRYPRILN
jgi:hypothetical protein